MIHSGSPPLCTILEESIDEDNTTSNGRGRSNLPIPQGCNVVTPTTPITTAPPTENTLTLLTTPTVPLQTSIPEPYTGHPPDRLEAYQEEQQACAHTQQAYIERRAAHQWGNLIDERVAIEAQLSELHYRKSVLETERVRMVDLTNAWARARDVIASINHEGPPRPAFTRANPNVSTTGWTRSTVN
jgi:hypothetical protein